jgi:hypothetical protein
MKKPSQLPPVNPSDLEKSDEQIQMMRLILGL